MKQFRTLLFFIVLGLCVSGDMWAAFSTTTAPALAAEPTANYRGVFVRHDASFLNTKSSKVGNASYKPVTYKNGSIHVYQTANQRYSTNSSSAAVYTTTGGSRRAMHFATAGMGAAMASAPMSNRANLQTNIQFAHSGYIASTRNIRKLPPTVSGSYENWMDDQVDSYGTAFYAYSSQMDNGSTMYYYDESKLYQWFIDHYNFSGDDDPQTKWEDFLQWLTEDYPEEDTWHHQLPIGEELIPMLLFAFASVGLRINKDNKKDNQRL